MKDSYEEIFKAVQRVLVILAHPDDAEVSAGGTIARLVEDKKQVTLVSVTNGSKGSRDNIISAEELIEMRSLEDSNSLKAYGLNSENKVSLGFDDGSVENSLETIEAIAKAIREFQPDLIITHNPEDVIIKHDSGEFWVNHRDHRNIAMSTVDATYPYSRDTLFFPDQLKELTSHTCTKFLFTDNFIGEDVVGFDVTDFMEQKIAATEAHVSQFDEQAAKDVCEFIASVPNETRKFERFKFMEID